MTPLELAAPVSEIELGELYMAMRKAGITDKGMNIIRRLAYERDMLRKEKHETSS